MTFKVEVYDAPHCRGQWAASNCRSLKPIFHTLEGAQEKIGEHGDFKYRYRVLDDGGFYVWDGMKGEAKATSPGIDSRPYSIQVCTEGDDNWSQSNNEGMKERFSSVADAIAIVARHGSNPPCAYRVTSSAATLDHWTGSAVDARSYTPSPADWVVTTVTSTKGTKMHNEPLTLPVDKVIERLEAQLETLQMTRNDLEVKAEESREELYRVLRGLTKAQTAKLVCILTGQGPEEAARRVKEKLGAGNLELPESKPTDAESTLERDIRALRMTTDKTIKVFASDDLFRLL